jgi:hypothetical protein
MFAALAYVIDWDRLETIPIGAVYNYNGAHVAQWRFVDFSQCILPSILLWFALFGLFALIFTGASRWWATSAAVALFWPASYGAGLTVASSLAVRISGSEVEYVPWLIGGLVGSLLGGLTAAICLLPVLICVGFPGLKRSAWLLISAPAWLLGWIFNLPALSVGLPVFVFVTAGVTALILYHLTIKWPAYDLVA